MRQAAAHRREDERRRHGVLRESEPGPGQNGPMARETSEAFQDRYPDDVAHCYGC